MLKIITLFFLIAFSLSAVTDNNELDINKLSTKEKVDSANSFITGMEKDLDNAYKLLKKTRKEKDIVKLNCVSDNVTQIKALLKRSKDDSINLTEAISQNEEKSIQHYFAKIYLAHKTIQQANISLLACSGTIVAFGESKDVEITIDELLVDEDYSDENDIVTLGSNYSSDEPIQISPYF